MDPSSAHSINCLLNDEYQSLNNNSTKCVSLKYADDPMLETIGKVYLFKFLINCNVCGCESYKIIL